jgi:hypothetical protein
MADIQKYLVQFDDAIRYERDDEMKILSEKRQRVLDRLSEGIKRQRRERKTIPSYEHFNQGSYAMKTGVKPVDRDFDIDVGLRFDIAKSKYDPVEVKRWVHDAVDGHTKKVELRRSCVTVFYQEKGEDQYHVDLAVYAGAGGTDYLAKGKINSAPEHRSWEESDPQGLIDAVASRFTGQDAEQFRRAIRALKRWKDERFSKDGDAAPKGIALTIAAYRWFQVSKQATGYNDLEALRGLASAMLSRFQPMWQPRLQVTLPVAPHSDLCAMMSDGQMREFKDRLQALHDALTAAHAATDSQAACKELRKQFGNDFPVPDQSRR